MNRDLPSSDLQEYIEENEREISYHVTRPNVIVRLDKSHQWTVTIKFESGLKAIFICRSEQDADDTADLASDLIDKIRG